jgi:hypothetical protein
MDLQGNIITSKRFLSINQSEDIGIFDLTVNSDSSVSLAGEIRYESQSGNTLDLDFLTIKIDKLDSMVLCKTVRDSSSPAHLQYCSKIVSTTDQGWIFLGTSADGPPFPSAGFMSYCRR